MRLSRRDVRLGTGLVLFGYVALHLLNHAMGLVSVRVAERALDLALSVWHGVPGTVVLYGAACIHIGLAFESLYGRRTLRMAPLDLIRIALGFGIPTLLITHAVSTRLAWEMYQQSSQYSRVVWSLWSSDGQGRQLALLVPGWLHGCFGIHLAFASRPTYQRLHRLLFAAALLLPVLGGLGFLAMGRELAADVAQRVPLDAALALPSGASTALIGWRQTLFGLYFSACAAVFPLRAARSWRERRSNASIRIQYPHGAINVPRGWSVLEASRSHHVPHVSMCGGRARCSTCRVRVTFGAQHCPPAQGIEAATLDRIHAPPGVRLACQLRPIGGIGVVPLLTVSDQVVENERAARMIEQDVVIVCIEWRNRVALARAVLPHDEVFLAGRFRQCVASKGLERGGLECDQTVDGTLFVFGIGIDLRIACQQALSAASEVEQALSELSSRWNAEFGVSAEFSIFINMGSAAIGHSHPASARRCSAAGPAIRAAQRLRTASAGARALVSVDVLLRTGLRTHVLARMDLPQFEVAPGLQVVAPASLQSLAQLGDPAST